jgi:hypothetical protein
VKIHQERKEISLQRGIQEVRL